MFSPLEISLQASRRIKQVLIALGAVLITLLTALPVISPSLHGALVLLALLQLIYWWRTYATPQTNASPCQLLVEGENPPRLRVLQHNGDDYTLPAQPVWLLSAGWVILKGPPGKAAVVLTTDNCDTAALRKLRVILRLSTPQTEPSV